MNILLANTSFAPAHGGPAISVSQLGAALAAHGARVGLWAPDGSAAASPAHPSRDGVTPLDGDLRSAVRRFGHPDVIHDNGIWRPHNHAVARYASQNGVPRLVSPRGMLEPSALAQKAMRKRFAWNLYQRRDLAGARAIHLTSEKEAQNFQRFGLPVGTHMIPNGVELPAPSTRETPRTRDGDERRIALFLSRVHPLKGLPMLIEAWSRLRPPEWRLIIAGPDEAGHAADIAKMAAERDLADAIDIVGPRYGEDKQALLDAAELFVLPTHTESFGMAIAEALAAELPVVTTTGAPWEELVTDACGWWVEPSTDAIADALHSALAMTPSELRDMGERGRALVARNYGWDGVARQFLALYGELCWTRGL